MTKREQLTRYYERRRKLLAVPSEDREIEWYEDMMSVDEAISGLEYDLDPNTP
jgi:hypothetical protein